MTDETVPQAAPTDAPLATEAPAVVQAAPAAPADPVVADPVAEPTVHTHLEAMEALAIKWGGDIAAEFRHLIAQVRELL